MGAEGTRERMGAMNLTEPRWQLFTIHGEPQGWGELHAANARWHKRKEGRSRGPGHSRADRAAVRSIGITDAGRAWLDEHRA